jgi:hypothetical protein
MNLAAILLLPRLLTGGAEPVNAVKLGTPRVQYRPNEASATRSPWIDANGWRIIREPGQSFVYHVPGEAAALATAEAFAYGTDALIATDAAGADAFNLMLDFLRQIPQLDVTPVTDFGVVDNKSDAAGELLNLLTRQNLLYKLEAAPDRSLRLNVRLGSQEYPSHEVSNPNLLSHKIRSQLGDENRSLRIYGSEVVIARLATNSRQGRVYLINYANRPVRGLRVRIRGAYAKGEARVFGITDAPLEDWLRDGDATEFTVRELNAFAVIDLAR